MKTLLTVVTVVFCFSTYEQNSSFSLSHLSVFNLVFSVSQLKKIG